MKNIAVFASGSGTNFERIVEVQRAGKIDANIALLVSDKPQAPVVEKANKHQIPTFVFSPKDYENKEAFESEILQQLQEHQVDFIVLAGYMRLIGSTLLSTYQGRIINIHPSLLPAFPGKDAIGQAFRAGVKVAGVTIHYVDEGMDTGPIIAQRAFEISQDDTLEILEQKIHQIEHELYPATLQQIIQNDRGHLE